MGVYLCAWVSKRYRKKLSSVTLIISKGESFSRVVANVLDCDIIVSKFELQAHYDVHFQTNTTGKGMNPLTPS